MGDGGGWVRSPGGDGVSGIVRSRIFTAVLANFDSRFILKFETIRNWWLVRITLVAAFGPKILGGGWDLQIVDRAWRQ